MTTLDWLLPGYGHIRNGFRRQAAKYVIFMGLWLAVVVTRGGRILEIAGGELAWVGVDGWVAVIALAAWPLAWMWAAHRGLARLLAPPMRESLSQWQIALRLLQKNERAMIGMQLLAIAYSIALLAPVLSSYDPERLPASGIVNKMAAPGTTIYVVGSKTDGELFCREFFEDPDQPGKVVFYLGEQAMQDKVVDVRDLGSPKRGWEEGMPPTGTVEIAGQEIPYRAEYHLLGTDDIGREKQIRARGECQLSRSQDRGQFGNRLTGHLPRTASADLEALALIPQFRPCQEVDPLQQGSFETSCAFSLRVEIADG